MTGMRLDAKLGGVNVRPGTGQQNTVDNIKQAADIGDVGGAGEHHRQGAGNLRHGPKISLSNLLHGHAIVK